MRNKWVIGWIAGIALAPFALMFLLHIGIALQQYFKININVPNIHAADWFMFAGSYLGGAITLFGVTVTLKYEQRQHQHQLAIESIEKEREHLFSVINKLDLFAPPSCYLDFTSAMCVREWDKLPNFSEVRSRIVNALRELNQSVQELQLGTDMCFQPKDCVTCKHPCRLPVVQNEFQTTYTYVNRYLYDTLQMLDAYIVDQYQNMLKDALIKSHRELNTQYQAQGNPPPYEERSFDEIQQQKKDLTIQEEEIKKRIDEIAMMNQKEMVHLVNGIREYYFLRIQNAGRIHSSKK